MRCFQFFCSVFAVLTAPDVYSVALAQDFQDANPVFKEELKKSYTPFMTVHDVPKPLVVKNYTAPSSSQSENEAAKADSFTFGTSGELSGDSIFGSSETPVVVQKQRYKPSLSGFVEVDAAYLPDRDSRSDVTAHVKVRPEGQWQINEHWSAKVAADIDHFIESGSNDFNKTEIRYNENYIRYGQDNFKVTVGAQKVIWGRVDGIKPTDQLGSQDFRTFITDDYEDRRQAIPALRGEYFVGDYKIDGLFAFDFRATETADRDSIWSLIDVDRGRVIGFDSNPLISPVIQNASFDEDDGGVGGGGVRVSKTGQVADFAFTAQRVRRTLPFYEVNPDLISAVQGGTLPAAALAALNGATLTTRHPWSWVVGGDVAIPVGSTILRAEGAWMSDVPVYTSTLTTDRVDSYMMVVGAEFYPGDGNLRVIIQGSAEILPDADAVRNEIYSINGSIEQELAHGRWLVGMDYLVGLDEHDIYLNPKITFAGLDEHSLYIEGHYFDGSSETVGGFFEDNSQIMAGWSYGF